MTVYVLSLFVIQPTLADFGPSVFLSSTVSTAVVFLAFFYASCKDPGTIMPTPDKSFLQLLRDINPADLCAECRVIKTVRSRHCLICNQCVERYDHHCPWINNCVGIKNHNAFMLFLTSIWVKIVIHAGTDVLSIIELIRRGLHCDTPLCTEFCVRGACRNIYVYAAACVITGLICTFYFVLSTVLLYCHIKNYVANRTTSERLAKRKKRTASRSSSSSNTQDLSSSILTYSDFEPTEVAKDADGNEILIDKKVKKKGCCINIKRMATHTKIVPQERLYEYLADRSIEIEEGELLFSPK